MNSGKSRIFAILLLVLWFLGLLGGSAVQASATSFSTHSSNAWGQPDTWVWPVTFPEASPRAQIIRSFDPPDRPWLPGHRGVDFAVDDGSLVRAPAPGVITFAGRVVNRDVLTIDHGLGLKSSFEPIVSTLTRGESVTRGEAVATVSDPAKGLDDRTPAELGTDHTYTHCQGQSCLHWGVRREKRYLNPLLFLADRRPSILLPWEEE